MYSLSINFAHAPLCNGCLIPSSPPPDGGRDSPACTNEITRHGNTGTWFPALPWSRIHGTSGRHSNAVVDASIA